MPSQEHEREFMGDPKIAKIPYDQRTDGERLHSNWNKANKLFAREDYSACIVRVATSAEIAANIYVRGFLVVEFNVPPKFVDALLVAANGLDGKFNRLVKPAAQHRDAWDTLKPLKKWIEALHDHRNGVIHSGKFKNEKDARVAFEESFAIIRGLAPNESRGLELPS
jgi:hypothetical protein